jgi:hypothetical protein
VHVGVGVGVGGGVLWHPHVGVGVGVGVLHWHVGVADGDGVPWPCPAGLAAETLATTWAPDAGVACAVVPVSSSAITPRAKHAARIRIRVAISLSFSLDHSCGQMGSQGKAGARRALDLVVFYLHQRPSIAIRYTFQQIPLLPAEFHELAGRYPSYRPIWWASRGAVA